MATAADRSRLGSRSKAGITSLMCAVGSMNTRGRSISPWDSISEQVYKYANEKAFQKFGRLFVYLSTCLRVSLFTSLLFFQTQTGHSYRTDLHPQEFPS